MNHPAPVALTRSTSTGGERSDGQGPGAWCTCRVSGANSLAAVVASPPERTIGMSDLFFLPVLLFGWFALFRWVLPALGVPTCMSGACGYASESPRTPEQGSMESTVK